MAADEGLPWALAGPACRVLLLAVCLVWRHLWVAMRQLPWPGRVWWAQLAATPLGAAAEEWQPLVPAAADLG